MPHLDNTITTGQLIQTITTAGVCVAFIFRKYFRSEIDSTLLVQHSEILKTSTENQKEIILTQTKQQTLLELLSTRVNTIEDRQWETLKESAKGNAKK